MSKTQAHILPGIPRGMEALLKNPALKLKLRADHQRSAARGEADAEEPRIRLQRKGKALQAVTEQPMGGGVQELQAQAPQQCPLLAVLGAG